MANQVKGGLEESYKAVLRNNGGVYNIRICQDYCNLQKQEEEEDRLEEVHKLDNLFKRLEVLVWRTDTNIGGVSETNH